MRTNVLCVGFDNITMDEAVEKAMELMEQHGSGYVVTPNPEIVWLCRKNPELSTAVESASLVLPDGIGIIYGAKILGRPLKEKVPGADFAERLFAEMAKTGKSVFLLGAKPGVAKTAGEKLTEKYPGLNVCGTADGYFKEDEPIINMINEQKPDLVLVCLGAPKQELWMSRNAEKLDVGLMAGLGGSLDVYAGVVQRAPEKWQKMNLEWLYRLIKQPSRFGRMMKLPAFLCAVVWQRIRGK
jgi:N-acetylglucosaminyldiphosphoundecaprenol N-acetyl-beta-D-mannosaminyltransferase